MNGPMSGAVITGIGCVTPIGIGVDSFSEALRHGISGVGPLTAMDATPYRCRVAAEVKGFEPLDFMPMREARSSPRVVQFAVAASRLALDHAGIRRSIDSTRTGVVLGTSVGPSAYNFEQFAVFIERGVRRIPPGFPAQAHYGVLASECAIQLDLHGPALSVSSACTSGADAIGMARAMILAGMADVVIAGGAEAPICPLLFAAFDRLDMMPTHFNDDPATASRPFAADRDGFVLGEGSAVFVVESEEHARARGARVLAVVAGYGATCDAKSHFSQDEGGDDAERAIRLALAMANVAPARIDYVNAHGSATRQNDPFETAVFRRVFGADAPAIPVSSSKSLFGHLLGASGAVEVAATLAAMEHRFLPPTLNLRARDPDCDLDYVPNASRPGAIDAALSTSFGFGSRNAALVLKRCGDEAHG
ncbi:MAG TPA: beta-ketoacyl-[acyl-carrier-protein] synthase family protein [Candidatus Binatia bacterium]|nr:beta-ketoacyl-[acyl-carrier-protein] synthase family protein [Candidatus Binatia bacterium]